MKKGMVLFAVMMTGLSHAHEGVEGTGLNDLIHQETILCDPNEGCEVICRQPGDRWNSYLKTAGDIKVTYFLSSGVRQLKADVGNGNYTILDTHPELQSCRITGVK